MGTSPRGLPRAPVRSCRAGSSPRALCPQLAGAPETLKHDLRLEIPAAPQPMGSIELPPSACWRKSDCSQARNRPAYRPRSPRGRQLGESGSGSAVSGQRIKRRRVLALIAAIGQLRTVPPMTIQTAPEPTHLLSMRDLSDRLDTPIDSLYKWSRRGFPDFPRSLRLPNGQIRVRVQDLNDWIEGRAQ